MKDGWLDRNLAIVGRGILYRNNLSEMMSGKSSAMDRVPVFASFEDFWQHYVTQHQHPVNQAMHIAGTLGGVVCLGLAISSSWWWLLALPPVGYGLAWIGHFLIERNRPLTLTYPLWSLRADYRLVARLLLRRPLIRPTVALYQAEAEHLDGAIRRQDHADDLQKPTTSRLRISDHKPTGSRVQ